MDAKFWNQVWKEGRTAFHQNDYHEKLLQYFPGLNPGKTQKVLVPLCGKTKDLLWLHRLGLNVHGVELNRQAAEEFIAENGLPKPDENTDKNFTHFTLDRLTLSVGDFFKLEAGNYDLLYDRASLVALPSPMRAEYAQVIKRSLKAGGKGLLIAYEYEPKAMEGPPFSVLENEIRELYKDAFHIQLLERSKPNHEGSRLAGVESLQQTVYQLQKI